MNQHKSSGLHAPDAMAVFASQPDSHLFDELARAASDSGELVAASIAKMTEQMAAHEQRCLPWTTSEYLAEAVGRSAFAEAAVQLSGAVSAEIAKIVGSAIPAAQLPGLIQQQVTTGFRAATVAETTALAAGDAQLQQAIKNAMEVFRGEKFVDFAAILPRCCEPQFSPPPVRRFQTRGRKIRIDIRVR